MPNLRNAAYGVVTQAQPTTDTPTVAFIAISRDPIRLERRSALTQTILRNMENGVWNVFIAVQGLHSAPTSVRRLPVSLRLFRYEYCSALFFSRTMTHNYPGLTRGAMTF